MENIGFPECGVIATPPSGGPEVFFALIFPPLFLANWHVPELACITKHYSTAARAINHPVLSTGKIVSPGKTLFA